MGLGSTDSDTRLSAKKCQEDEARISTAACRLSVAAWLLSVASACSLFLYMYLGWSPRSMRYGHTIVDAGLCGRTIWEHATASAYDTSPKRKANTGLHFHITINEAQIAFNSGIGHGKGQLPVPLACASQPVASALVASRHSSECGRDMAAYALTLWAKTEQFV
ncbi:hypothetical protein ACTFIU_009244 [Dictyostelium citrinum]